MHLSDAKRLIGRKFDDATVQADMKHWPFKVVQGEGARPKIQVEVKGEVKSFFPEVCFPSSNSKNAFHSVMF
jgi:heat shock 70kDa protein 1/2/6/8